MQKYPGSSNLNETSERETEQTNANFTLVLF